MNLREKRRELPDCQPIRGNKVKMNLREKRRELPDCHFLSDLRCLSIVSLVSSKGFYWKIQHTQATQKHENTSLPIEKKWDGVEGKQTKPIRDTEEQNQLIATNPVWFGDVDLVAHLQLVAASLMLSPLVDPSSCQPHPSPLDDSPPPHAHQRRRHRPLPKTRRHLEGGKHNLEQPRGTAAGQVVK
jgi:hypothetical protein